MKASAIINGKKYSTETADLLADKVFDSDDNKGRHFSESLYLKITGEYFLLGVGGCDSKYSRRVGPDQWAAGKWIMPLSEMDARLWAEKAMSVAEYEHRFGEVPE